MQIYRGATWGRRRRTAWTTDIDTARWFARRYGRFAGGEGFTTAQVFGCVIEPEGVLARIVEMRKGEAEVVVDPAHLPSLGRATIVETAEREPDET